MLSILHHWLANGLIAYRRHQATGTFSVLSDAQLLDMGLERHAIEEHVRDSLPWQSFEPHPRSVLHPVVNGCG